METNYNIGMIAPIHVGQDLDLEVSNPGEGFPVPIFQDGDFVEILPGEDPDSLARSFHYYGQVTDADNGAGIPGATVKIYANGKLLTAGAADNDGNFDVYINDEADSIQITSVGYQGKLFPLTLIGHHFSLIKDEKELDPVIVTATRKNQWLLLLVVGYIVYEESKPVRGKRKR